MAAPSFKSQSARSTARGESMMRAMVDKARGKRARVVVSLEKRMACGVGACLVCTCKTTKGNRKTCTDGPVFEGEEVFFDGFQSS